MFDPVQQHILEGFYREWLTSAKDKSLIEEILHEHEKKMRDAAAVLGVNWNGMYGFGHVVEIMLTTIHRAKKDK